MKMNQKGFGLLPVIVVVLVLGVAGFAGWKVWTTQNKKEASNTIQGTSATSSKKTDSDSSSAPQTATDYLVIKEWGVKVPLTEVTKAAYYKMENGNAYLYVDIQEDTKKECSNQAAISKIATYSENAENPREQTSFLEKYASKAGNAYYLMEGSQSACTQDERLQASAFNIRSKWLEQSKLIVSQ